MQATNPWVPSTALSYEQIVDAARAKFETELPEITDQSDNEKAIRLMQISAGIAEVTNILADNLYRENFPAYARLFESLVTIAKGEDYRVKGTQAATGLVKITSNIPVVTGFSISDAIGSEGPLYGTEGGLQYRLTGAYNWPNGASQLIVSVREQNLIQTKSQAGTGKYLQEVTLPEDTSDSSILVRVNSITATRVESFVFARDITKFYYIVEMDQDRNLVVRFGDDATGLVPEIGQTIEVFYETCQGSEGNAAVGAVNRILSGMPTITGVTFSCTNEDRITGGRDPETPEQISNSIIRFKRTLDRAVTLQDFVDIALLHPKVRTATAKAGCQRIYTVYVYGFGGQVSAPDLVSVKAFIQSRILTPRETQVEVLNVPEIIIKQDWKIIVAEGYSRVLTKQLANQTQSNYLSRDNSKIALEVRVGNLYKIMESVEGVEDSDLVSIYAVPNPTAGSSNTTSTLTWSFSLHPGVQNQARFILKFDSSSNFRVFKNGVYVANYATGVLVDFPEISFTVTGSYVAGDQFGFFTYPFSNNIQLQEIGIPISETGDITITETGGY